MSEFTLKSRSKTALSMEMIDFQEDNFGEKIELCVADIRKMLTENSYIKPSVLESSPQIKKLQKTIFERLGLQFAIITDEALAAVMPFFSNKNHVFLKDYFRGDFSIKDQDKILDKSNRKKGYVDSKRAKVSGFFSEHEHQLWLDFKSLFNLKLSDAEVCAVILHELGHAFTACEYSDRLETNNQILAAVAKEINTKKEKTNVTYVFKELEKVNPKITEKEVEDLVNGDRVVAGVIWMRVIVGSVQDQLKNAKYTETSFEQMSDNFSTRFGYGKPLITALDKIHDYYWSPEKNRGFLFLAFLMETVYFIMFAKDAFFFIIAGSIFMGVLLGIIAMFMFRGSAADFKDMTYDELKIRYKRIRDQLVARLKNTSLKTGVIAQVVNDIYVIDEIIKNTYQGFSLLGSVSTFIFGDARAAKTSIEREQLLEEIAHNDLFLSAARFKLSLNKSN